MEEEQMDMGMLEGLVNVLDSRKPPVLTATDLYMMGFDPYHRTLRKQIGQYGLCYRECPDNKGFFEFVAIYRIE